MAKFRPHRSEMIRHPLEGVVLEAFRVSDAHDALTLSAFMKGVTWFSGPRAATGDRAYKNVAEDVLGCMESQGKLRRDSRGWYLLADPAGSEAQA